MGYNMVRQPSETPNIQNTDDFVGLRYAYGNQNGYVKNMGTELKPEINGSSFIVGSGRVVLQGVETDIDSNGVSFTIDNVAETRYFTVYYEVNLGEQGTYIKISNYSTSGYPVIEAGDDLTKNSSIGIARLELYHFTANGGVISNVEKLVKGIEYVIPKRLIWSGSLELTEDINELESQHGNQITFSSSIYNKWLEIHFSYIGSECTLKVHVDNGGIYQSLFYPEVTIQANDPKMIKIIRIASYSNKILGFAGRIYTITDLINNPSFYNYNTGLKITKIYEILE